MDSRSNFDFSKIIQVEGDTEKPIHNHQFGSSRAHCVNLPENSTILDRLEKLEPINLITDEKLVKCDKNLFTHPIRVIKTLEELQRRLSDVLIRFDTRPANYEKKDYQALLKLITETLINIYKRLEGIVTSWEQAVSDETVPSSKLVRDSLASLEGYIEGISSTVEILTEKVEELEQKIVDVNDAKLTLKFGDEEAVEFSANASEDKEFTVPYQVQSNWDQEDEDALDYIKNKPTEFVIWESID